MRLNAPIPNIIEKATGAVDFQTAGAIWASLLAIESASNDSVLPFTVIWDQTSVAVLETI